MNRNVFYIAILFFVPHLLLASQKGIEIRTEGTFLGKAQRQKIANLLVSNPGALLSDIDFTLETRLLEKKKELQVIQAEKVSRAQKKETGQEIAKVKRMIDRQIGFIHEAYIEADTLNDILVKNPFLVRMFQSEARPAEAELYFSKNEFAQAFNTISQSLGEDSLSYEEYLNFKENYKDNPFFGLIHHIRECVGCGLAREKVPFVREYLEKQITDYVQSQFPNKDRQIIITDFASGNLFQIFVVVNKLAALGYKNIRLNLIDIQFENIVQLYQQQMETTPLLIETGPFDLTQTEIDYIADFTAGFGEKERALDTLVNVIDDTKMNNTLAHFSKWFNGSGLNLEIVIYANATDYLADCSTNPSLKGDLLLAVDYFTELNHILEKLRVQGLKETGMAFSLDHADIDDSFDAAEFYFSKGTQTQKAMDHFEWNLSTKHLMPIEHLPQTLDYKPLGPQLAEIFKA